MRSVYLLTLLTVLACRSGTPAADVAAEVDGRAVPYAEFEAYLAASAITDAPSLDSEVLSGLFDQFLEELLLIRFANDEGVPASGRQAMVAALVASQTAEVAEQEVADFYYSNPARFQEPERVRLRQILVEDLAAAQAAERELAEGSAFEIVTSRHSQGPQAQFGGDQGILSREDLPPELAARIFELGAGQLSGIIEADYGFHIFQVVERLPASEVPLDRAAPEIAEELTDLRREQTLAELLERAVKRYNMRLFAGNLPFQYQGKYG